MTKIHPKPVGYKKIGEDIVWEYEPRIDQCPWCDGMLHEGCTCEDPLASNNPRPYENILMLYFDPVMNKFKHWTGETILNILEYLTEDDVYMFKEDYGNCFFPLICDNRTLVEIIIEE